MLAILNSPTNLISLLNTKRKYILFTHISKKTRKKTKNIYNNTKILFLKKKKTHIFSCFLLKYHIFS